jgi:hypothetical protein
MSEDLDDDEILIRGVKKSHLLWSRESQTVTVALDCFRLRPQDTDGLSVERKSLTTHEAASQRGRFPCFVGITVGEVKALGLFVSKKEGSPSGATIVGLPAIDKPMESDVWAARLAFAFHWDLAPTPELVEKMRVKNAAPPSV